MAGLSRRRVLIAGASIGGGWSAAVGAVLQQMSQAAALYQDHPNNGFSCAACALFRPPAACVVVAGEISPAGWCRFFDLPD